jgi:hypothetical protein
MIKRNLTALLHRSRCDRTVLLPMVEALTPQQQEALWRLLQHVQDDAKRDGAREGARQPWKHGVFR